MSRRLAIFAAALLALALGSPAAAAAAEGDCELTPRAQCFGVASLDGSLSTTQAGAHPDLTFSFEIKQDPESDPNVFGLKDAYAPTRDVRIELPPGLIGDPNVLGVSQQCTAAELTDYIQSGGCPNGSQVGLTEVYGYELFDTFLEPVFMMQPPGGEIVARLGFIAGIVPTYVDLRVRSEGDYGLTAEVNNAPTLVKLVKSEVTTWGVPADPSHDTERCTIQEAFNGCQVSPERPPGSRPLPFLTNPTRCGVPLAMRVGASSWAEPERFDTKSASFPQISGCNKLPFGPGLTVEPTSHEAASATGADVTIRLPASDGVEVLEPSQIKDITVQLPEGLAFNPAAGDGLETCSAAQVGLETGNASRCPDGAKLADTEFDVPVLERNLKGAVYLREPEPGRPFRIWITADDLGLHVKLPGELEVDKQTGQITSITTDVPQAPLREARLRFKSGLRAPLIAPDGCGTYRTTYEFTPWSGGPPVTGSTPMTISEGCDTGGFDPKLAAGTTDPSAGEHSPFLFTLRRQDGEQNPASLDITLPKGLAATFKGLPRCEGTQAATGTCSPASRIGHVIAAVGAGPNPLWVPQAGKRPTAVYLGGPYKGGPLSIVAVVPRQAGPFDFGDEVVRSAVYVDPVTVQATIKSDPLPQRIEGIPIGYRTLHVAADRENFTLNPTGCSAREVVATVASSQGALANPTSPFRATDCADLPFKPRIALKLLGGTKRGDHPAFQATVRPRAGDANLSRTVVKLPRSAFLDQAHIRTVCTRVQFAAEACPPGAVYGKVTAHTPLLDEPLTGPAILRSSDNLLPDLVFDLNGPASLPIEIEAAGRVDSVKGGIRATFASIPDAPLTKVVVQMQGGQKGLIVNSRNLCGGKASRAEVRLGAHNGRRATLRPKVEANCGAKRKHGSKSGRR
ncbi:MAG TPA: hypothetical protein VIS95_02845 [Solirubrobacterales bacterium]